jgi:hypothetical protein
VRRLLALSLCSLLVLAAACDDDDDGDATPTTAAATSQPATATSAPAGSPTPGAEAAIVIEAPAEGTTVRVPFEASGTANVFEGALTVDVLGGAAGTVLCTRHVQASSGTGTPGDWSGIIAFPPPAADAPITLRAYTFSAMDGSMQDIVERPLTVSAEHPNIVIETPSCAEEVAGGPLAVSGMAQVFEAALSVDVRDASGTAVVTQQVMAASGVEYSPWSTTLDLSGLNAGFYDVVAYTHSAQDGRVIDEFPVQISVR